MMTKVDHSSLNFYMGFARGREIGINNRYHLGRSWALATCRGSVRVGRPHF